MGADFYIVYLFHQDERVVIYQVKIREDAQYMWLKQFIEYLISGNSPHEQLKEEDTKGFMVRTVYKNKRLVISLEYIVYNFFTVGNNVQLPTPYL